MRPILTLWKRELKSAFVSPIAYAFLAVYLFLAGVFFVMGITLTGEASLRVLFGNLAITQLFLLPMLTMRQIAEERRQGTLELLLTSPVSPGAVVAGKWLASMTLCGLLFAGTLLFPGILAYYGDPDWGMILTGYLGQLLVAAVFCAGGLLASSLVEDQVAAGLIGIVLLIPLWLVGRLEGIVPDAWFARLKEASLLAHLDSFNRGALDTVDAYYFLALASFFLFLTWRSVESRRWR